MYEFYFLVVKNNILLAALVRKILFLPLENKIHTFALPCKLYPLYSFKEKFKEKEKNYRTFESAQGKRAGWAY